MKYKKIIFFTVFFFLFYASNFAMALEVRYPTLRTGATITPNTPLPEYLKYVFDFGMFIGFFTVFLTLVFAGVLYLLSPAIPNAKEIAKDRVSGAITGLLILATLYLIITTINPQLKFFKLDELDAIPPPPDPEQQAGVYFYNQIRDCPGPETPHITSIPHLGPLTNRVNAINIVHRPNEDLYYIAVLYDSPNFWGKCQYVDPNSPCVSVDPFAASASIYQYDPTPNGDGIIFYRKSFYNREGGWYKVPNSAIIESIESGEFYNVEFSKLKFTDRSAISKSNPDGCTVPEKERDCILWDQKGVCEKRQCPFLSGENITSIEIKGDYMVLFIYYNELLDKYEGPWSFCQAFSTKDDINKDGPKQIKWENVRNINTGMLPNSMIIFSVKQK